MFEVSNAPGPLSGRLRDLTKTVNSAEPSEAADVQGNIPGVSEGGSYVYFLARGVLTTVKSGERQEPVPGGDNLYIEHYNSEAGQWEEPRFIATLSEEDADDWDGSNLISLTSRVSPNGQYLAFMSERSLTGYDNTDVNEATGLHADEEVFLYDTATNRLVCASCNPTGARPVGVHDPDRELLPPCS